ncbi:hypothetical protein Sango_2110300 [Sesamum angolense]|uniref:Integrase catalytic domain-containing protein n=1 Tax=Sesamum angolense TaxID=2727404 RepID=A0AAE2BM63_9LAMI|nr:hypothetical protein Sango_2110300 [Sesamum angolense]
MPRHSLGGTSRRAHLCVGAAGLLLATDADDIETYVHTCLICQQDKADHQKKAGLLQPLPIPKRPWESVSMDYILDYLRLLGSTLSMSSSYHPQSDGQTERFNSMLEEYLRHFQPLLPHTLDSPQGVRSPLARSFSQEWKQNVEIARSCLEKAQKRMKKYADNNRRFVESMREIFDGECPGPEIIKVIKGRDPRLMQKYRPFTDHQIDKEDDARNQPSRPQLELTKTKEKVAEAILNHRVTSTAKRTHNEYLVKWKDAARGEHLERVTNLKAFLPLVQAYHASHARGHRHLSGGENVKGRPYSRHP